MDAFLRYLEVHKDSLDILIKAAGGIATIIGAGYVVWKHYSDKEMARQHAELDLRRQAYFDLFTAMPLQFAALRKFVRDNEKMIEIPTETYTALFRLHLLASNDALQCIIARNAMFHEGVIQMTVLKRRALQFALLGDSDPRVTEKVANTWEAFHARKKQLLTELNGNYRELLVYARKEIGLKGEMKSILAALERDETKALNAME